MWTDWHKRALISCRKKWCCIFAFLTCQHLDIRTRSSKQLTNPPQCCSIDPMVNRDYCSVKNCRYNSSSNKRTERFSFHKQSHLTSIWKRFIKHGKARNHTVGEIHFENFIFVHEYSMGAQFSATLCSTLIFRATNASE